VNTDALFKAVDVDNSGTITEDEWMEFWNSVKKSGYSEEEIEEEVKNSEKIHKHIKADYLFKNKLLCFGKKKKSKPKNQKRTQIVVQIK